MSCLRMLCPGALVLSTVLVCLAAHAQVVREELSVDGTTQSISVTRFGADIGTSRPAVLVLHGSSGLDFGAAGYERYAIALAQNGIDAYVVSYFKRGTGSLCQCWDTWAQAVSDVVSGVLRRPDSSRKIGLLGFSLGSAVAVASARDARISALVTYGAFLPYDKQAWPDRLPPIAILHGEADESVPLDSARELAAWATGHGHRVVFHVYPGEGHRQSQWQEQSAKDALYRALTFFREELQTGR
jgi:carboxymethylenebutenolidase